ncbi:early protein E7 [Papio hamadryas papillomavirus 1]|uniref:Protein E7 n=1 Tax=Papio hamadryas papillomavirus 1 TaxID=990303 RepID=H9LC15_RHPV1|nr:E7 gene product [Papio hamadryas papillomavirus 1]AEA35048.1 early protein E7 [Papio hamadryas papillomavirus 1]
MIGPHPTLADIVLELEPEPVDLRCYEQLDSSDDEDEIDHHQQQARPVHQEDGECFRILSDCHICQNTVSLVVYSTHDDLHVLEDLLMGNLEIVCPNCAI